MLTLKQAITTTLLSFTVVAVSGCAVTDTAKDRAADRAADVVHDYCERTSTEDQEALRARMDSRTAPHVVRFDCGREEPAE